jgi:hypothetical protein
MTIDYSKLTTALAKLNIPYGKQIRYEAVAKALNFKPKKVMKGKETNQVLNVGGQKYKETVYNEVIKRYDAIIKAEELATQQVLDANKKKRGRPKKIVPVVKKVPKLVEKKLIESVKQKFYNKYRYTYENNKDEEDLYNAIVKEFENNKGGSFVSLIFRDKTNTNKIKEDKGRSIATGFLDSFEDFMFAVKQAMDGGSAEFGSDAIEDKDYELDYNHFSIIKTVIAHSGKSDDMLFFTKMIESKEGLCGYLSLKECGVDAKVKPETLKYFDNLSSYILKNELSIAVIANSFSIKKEAVEMITSENKSKIRIADKIGKIKQYITTDVKDDDVDVIYLLGNKDAKHTLIYDEVNQHIDYVVGKPKLLSNIKISTCSNVFKNDKIIFTPKKMNINSKKEEVIPIEYLFFDYETVIDFNTSSCMKSYSLSILRLTPFQLDRLEELDELGRSTNKNFIQREDALRSIELLRKQTCITFLGFDCGEKFINWFLENSQDKMFVFVGFNNTNFDNFLMLEDFLMYKENQTEQEITISDVFYNGSQLLNFKINKIHNFFDIRKHLMGSLKNNCKSFKIESCAKKEFDHNEAQRLYDNGELIEYINNDEKLKEYNEYDVLATAVLFKRYVKALAAIPATEEYSKELHSIKTIGSLVYKVFTDNKKKLGFKLPKLEFNIYDDLQNSKIAGRVEMFNGVKEVNERLVSTDVCSLYPFVMSVLNCYYPTGDKLIEVDSYKGDDEIGFYYCDIDQSCLALMDLPNIYAKKNAVDNDWSYKGVLENYLISNVMIGLLRKFNCNVVVKKGFIFPSKLKSCEMFGFLLDFMKAKNEQDTLSKKNDPSYNPALRETYKLLMNSLSGKVIEGLHTEKTVDVDSAYEFLQLKEKATSINFINSVGGKLFVTYEINPEDICSKQQRPIYLGVLIYDYAKRYMYENSYSKVGKSRLLYTDTDASKFRYKDFVNWKSWIDTDNIQVPHWPEVEAYDARYKNHKIYDAGSKVFGSFEDELEKCIGDEYIFYCLEKKSWLYGYKHDDKWETKFRFKGLNGSAQILTLEESFIRAETVQHKAKDDKEAWNETKFNIMPECEYEVHQYYLNNKQNNIENGNEIKFFKQIFTTGKSYVLCSSFRKIVKNSSRNVSLEDEEGYNNLMNKIQVNYMVKKIEIK